MDPNHDPNMFSFYYRSRLDIHLANGAAFDCEDVRTGCPGMTADNQPPNSSYLATDTSADAGPVPADVPPGTGIYPKTAQVP